jgi:hypothetical protein
MIIRDRRSGIDTRSETEKQLIGERRSGVDRRAVERQAPATPSNEQLALFARRLRRIMRDEKGRSHLGIANAEHEFSFFPDVIQVVAWIERLGAVESGTEPRPTLRKAVSGPANPAVAEAGGLQAGSPDRDVR